MANVCKWSSGRHGELVATGCRVIHHQNLKQLRLPLLPSEIPVSCITAAAGCCVVAFCFCSRRVSNRTFSATCLLSLLHSAAAWYAANACIDQANM